VRNALDDKVAVEINQKIYEFDKEDKAAVTSAVEEYWCTSYIRLINGYDQDQLTIEDLNNDSQIEKCRTNYEQIMKLNPTKCSTAVGTDVELCKTVFPEM
jgi:hypothetical protein